MICCFKVYDWYLALTVKIIEVTCENLVERAVCNKIFVGLYIFTISVAEVAKVMATYLEWGRIDGLAYLVSGFKSCHSANG